MINVEMRVYHSADKQQWFSAEERLQKLFPPLLLACSRCSDCNVQLFGCASSHAGISANFWGLIDLPVGSRIGDMLLVVGFVLRRYLGNQDIELNDHDARLRRVSASAGIRLPQPYVPLRTK